MEKVPDEESRIGGNGMSARIKMCVLRVPCEKVKVEDPWAFSEEHEDFFPAWDPYPHFAVAPTEHRFIDYVLSERLAQGESYGKTRGLTPAASAPKSTGMLTGMPTETTPSVSSSRATT